MTINKLLQGTFCEIGRQIPGRGKFPMEFLFWLACDSRSEYDPFPVLPLPFAFLFGLLSSSISFCHFPFFKCEISNMLIAFPKIDTWHAIQLDIELNDIQLSFSLTS